MLLYVYGYGVSYCYNAYWWSLAFLQDVRLNSVHTMYCVSILKLINVWSNEEVSCEKMLVGCEHIIWSDPLMDSNFWGHCNSALINLKFDFLHNVVECVKSLIVEFLLIKHWLNDKMLISILHTKVFVIDSWKRWKNKECSWILANVHKMECSL